MLGPLIALLLGVIATLAALRVRRHLVASLGEGYVPRFLAVQGGAINGVLYVVVRWAAGWMALGEPFLTWGLPVAYGLLFFVYSLSNIDWTARKFHDVEG